MKKSIVFLLTIALGISSLSQNTKIGEWEMHLNYTNTNVITSANNVIYVGTKSGLFSFREDDNSITKFSKLDGLSSINITAINYKNGKILIGYSDGNIDIIENGNIINIPDIASANIIGDKKIKNIFIDSNLAFLSCSFGIVVLNLANNEVKETYYLSNDGTITDVFEVYVFNEEINSLSDSFLSNKIFAATNKGVFYADKTGNLLDFSEWNNSAQISLSKTSDKYIYDLKDVNLIGISGYDNKENGGKGLVVITDIDYSKTANPWVENSKFNFFELETAKLPEHVFFTINLEVPGEIIDLKYNPTNKKTIIISNDNYTQKVILLNEWFENILSVNVNNIASTSKDLSLKAAILSNSYNDSKHMFLADEKLGIILAKNNNSYTINALEFIAPNGPAGINIGSINNNNRSIMLTHGGKTQPWNNLYNYQEISFLKDGYWSKSSTLTDLQIHDAISVSPGFNSDQFFVGTWNNGLLEFLGDSLVNHYNSKNTNGAIETMVNSDYIRIGGIDIDQNNALWLTNSQANKPLVKFFNNSWTSYSVPNLSTNTMSGKIMCTSEGQKWIQLRDDGILVAKENEKGIISKKLGTGNGLPSTVVNCFVEEHDGSVWVGTSQGLSIFYFPSEIFNNPPYSAEYILIETEDGYVEKLFENTEILDIKVDGGNRKWIGTKANGVFLISDDGTSQVYNFTKENSPLLNNTVYEIIINDYSGEVFFATAQGLCSYRSNATASKNNFNNVLVFPNPVRRGYVGDIAISGLSDETIVKITDISGNLVFETKSFGGTATWDGLDFNGRRVSTGVYLFLCTSSDFETSVAKKVLIYN